MREKKAPPPDIRKNWGVPSGQHSARQNQHLVTHRGVGADECVPCNRLSERLHCKNIGNNLFRLLVEFSVDQRTVVVARDHIPKSRETLLHSLYQDTLRKLQGGVGGAVGGQGPWRGRGGGRGGSNAIK